MPVSTPIQRTFNFTGMDRACLALVPTVKCLLACDEDRVLDLILDRQLVAFDLRGKGAEKSFPGIWFQSLRSLCRRIESGADRQLFYNGEATHLAISDLLPKRELLPLSFIRVALCVTSGHLHNLINDGLIAGRGGDRVSKAPMILRSSVAEFLTQRRMR